MEEKKPEVSVEIVTEFDRALSKYTRKLFIGVSALVISFLLIEFVLIFFMLSTDKILKIQTMNGAIVGGCGLAIIAFSSAYFLWPTKLMGWEALKITREMRDKSDEAVAKMRDAAENMNKFVTEARPMIEKFDKAVTGTKLEELTLRFERKMDEAIDAFGANDPIDPKAEALIDPAVAARIRAQAQEYARQQGAKP